MNLNKYEIEKLIDFCGRWKEKIAQENLNNNLAYYYDKFISAYIIFNAIYSKVCNGSGDRDNATNKIINYIGIELISQNILCPSENEIKGILHLFNDYQFCGKPIPKKNRDDQHLKEKLESDNEIFKTQGLFWLIYEVRCNLFHGEKEYEDTQKNILGRLCTILERINNFLIEKLQRQYNIEQ
jgi:hypothetical protein